MNLISLPTMRRARDAHRATLHTPSPARREFDVASRQLHWEQNMAYNWIQLLPEVQRVEAQQWRPLRSKVNRYLLQMVYLFEQAYDAAGLDTALDEDCKAKLSWLICAFGEQVLMENAIPELRAIFDRHYAARAASSYMPQVDDDDDDAECAVFMASNIVHIPPSHYAEWMSDAATPPESPPAMPERGDALKLLTHLWRKQKKLDALDALDDAALYACIVLIDREVEQLVGITVDQQMELDLELGLPIGHLTPLGAIHHIQQSMAEQQAVLEIIGSDLQAFRDPAKLRARLEAYTPPPYLSDCEGDWFVPLELDPDWERLYTDYLRALPVHL